MLGFLTLLASGLIAAPVQADILRTQANIPAEITLAAARQRAEPFSGLTVDVVFTDPAGAKRTIPAFWDGDRTWRARYASSLTGRHRFRTLCSDPSDAGLNGVEGTVEVVPYTGANPLFRHGPLRIAHDHRHFEHADGTPFFWLGDTWWKGLCKRLTWEGFQELAADRKQKGFSVVQIVCGPYPDEPVFDARWENEGGKPYLTRGFTRSNPDYYRYADRRVRHLVDCGIVPAIVGGWGRGDCDGMRLAGVEGMKRHWRHLVARYGAYPAVWIVGGESGGPEWTEVARYLRSIDPYHHPITIHPFHTARTAVTDESVLDFDMLQTGHGDWTAAKDAIPQLLAAYGRAPHMPVLIGEFCYEGHMQAAYQDVQRYVFWASLLSGAAGLTYGAAGVWNAGVEGDPGTASVYDWTTWQEGMHYPGSTEVGLGKRLLESYAWQGMEAHPEWTEPGAFAAGVPGGTRFVYVPKRPVYNWSGTFVRDLDPGARYHAFFFDPATGRRFDQGTVVNPGPGATPFEEPAPPPILEDRFDGAASPAWTDAGARTTRERSRLIAGKGTVTILDAPSESDVAASVEASRDVEAGIILRYHGPDDYLVALYSPLYKAIYLHDRRGGAWRDQLGRVEAPDIAPRFRLTVAATGEYAAMSLTDGTHTYSTPAVKVTNVAAGRAGLWLFQIGDRQEFGAFQLSRMRVSRGAIAAARSGAAMAFGGVYRTPNVPSPQDWVLVLERLPIP